MTIQNFVFYEHDKWRSLISTKFPREFNTIRKGKKILFEETKVNVRGFPW